MIHTNLSAYEGVESLSRFTDDEFKVYCDDKLASVDKHIHFLKKHIVSSGSKIRVVEIGSGNGKLLFRMEEEGLLEYGFGYEVSKSRCEFANRFKAYVNSKKVEIRNENIFDMNPLAFKSGVVDLVIGVDIVINLIGGMDIASIDNCIQLAKRISDNGYVLFEFETFDTELNYIKLSEKSKYRTWKEFSKTDPFIYGLDELEEKKELLNGKFFYS